MKNFPHLITAAALVGAALFPITATAVPVTFSFSGNVTLVNDDPQNILDLEFDTSQSISGSYTFDDATPDSGPSALTGNYQQAITSFSATIGSYSFSAGSDNNATTLDGDIHISLGNSNDAYNFDFNTGSFGSLSGPDVVNTNGTRPINNFRFDLLDSDATTFSTDALQLPVLADFESRAWRLVFAGSQKYVEGEITSLTQTAVVPVPAAFWLFGSGLLGLIATRKKRALLGGTSAAK